MKKIFSIFFIIIFLFIPVTSLADDYIENDFSEEIKEFMSVSSNLSEAPSINAKFAVVLDRKSQTVLYGKNENEKCKMASTTKIMTAIVVLENCSNLNDVVTISKKAAGIGGSRLGLSPNDKISVENLLYGLLLCSGNDAAVALAEYTGGSIENFANIMNQKVSELGLKSTHFVTPHGLDNDEHYTTAYELALITNYALKNDVFARIVKTINHTININGTPKQLHNTNELLGTISGIYGVKTGFTNGANRCLVTSCKRNDLDVICVVLGCDTKKDRTTDSIKLLNYTFSNFSLVDLKSIAYEEFNKWNLLHSNSFTINKGINNQLKLYLDENDFPFYSVAIENAKKDSINIQISCSSNFEAPLYPNSKIGILVLRVNNEIYYSIDILNKNSIEKKNIFDYIFFIFRNYCNFLIPQ